MLAAMRRAHRTTLFIHYLNHVLHPLAQRVAIKFNVLRLYNGRRWDLADGSLGKLLHFFLMISRLSGGKTGSAARRVNSTAWSRASIVASRFLPRPNILRISNIAAPRKLLAPSPFHNFELGNGVQGSIRSGSLAIFATMLRAYFIVSLQNSANSAGAYNLPSLSTITTCVYPLLSNSIADF